MNSSNKYCMSFIALLPPSPPPPPHTHRHAYPPPLDLKTSWIQCFSNTPMVTVIAEYKPNGSRRTDHISVLIENKPVEEYLHGELVPFIFLSSDLKGAISMANSLASCCPSHSCALHNSLFDFYN